MTGSEEVLGVAIVRAWIERGPPRVLKVRVMAAPDVGSTPRTIGVTKDVEKVCDYVREWLEDIVGARANA